MRRAFVDFYVANLATEKNKLFLFGALCVRLRFESFNDLIILIFETQIHGLYILARGELTGRKSGEIEVGK